MPREMQALPKSDGSRDNAFHVNPAFPKLRIPAFTRIALMQGPQTFQACGPIDNIDYNQTEIPWPTCCTTSPMR